MAEGHLCVCCINSDISKTQDLVSMACNFTSLLPISDANKIMFFLNQLLQQIMVNLNFKSIHFYTCTLYLLYRQLFG